MYAGAARRGLGDAESDFNDANPTGPDAWTLAIRAIHSVSVPMGLLRKRITQELNAVGNADSVVDFNQLQADITQMASYSQQLPALIAAAKSLPEYTQDVATANELNNWLAFLIDWGGATLQVVGQLPTDAANYMAQQLSGIVKAAGDAAGDTAWQLLKVLLPIGLVLVLGLKYVQSAERTRTGRALVRRV